jgi:addiction module HigA family antidote
MIKNFRHKGLRQFFETGSVAGIQPHHSNKLQAQLTVLNMHNPAHPGVVLREYLGDLTVTESALRLGVTRTALSRILNGSAGISADMSIRLSEAFNTTPLLWLTMQNQYDVWQASQRKRKPIKQFFKTDAA